MMVTMRKKTAPSPVGLAVAGEEAEGEDEAVVVLPPPPPRPPQRVVSLLPAVLRGREQHEL